MRRIPRKFLAFAAVCGGLTLSNGCSLTESILSTISLAFNIVDVWV